MSDMLIVVKPPSGDALNKLVTFLVENRLEFSVRRSEPIKGAPIAHVTNMQSGDYDPGMSISGKKPLICQLCGKGIIKTTGPSRKQHAIHHLKLKTWKCIVCNRSLSHPDAGRDHFRSMHRDEPYIRLVETMSEEEKIQIDEMQIKCFPSKPIHQTRHQNDH
ncbi:hypothetical protein L5515_009514 [Caenorhabditis briggsae]|uniref:C2H2-type domain-containing protein n=1 Tax=Caenorhabditis briggsae TaxID=6238 RepID=A0AAE9JNS7_CAEBR|nr:hypothetical protein L5515_009514 [Caenorhabditis briggsae]